MPNEASVPEVLNPIGGFTRKEGKQKCLEYQLPILNTLKVDPLQFDIKPAFFRPGGIRMIGLYEEDLRKGTDLYFEFVTKANLPSEIADGRPLYLWRYNPYAKDEYEQGDFDSLLVPVSELEKVDPIRITALGENAVTHTAPASLLSTANLKPQYQQAPPRTQAPSVSTPVANLNTVTTSFGNLTAQEAAAIFWRLPVSGNPEIDQFILKWKQ